MGVHPTALVDETAALGDGVEIGPFAIIGAGVRIGSGSRIHGHAVIEGDTVLGKRCVVFPQAVIGTVPQDKKLEADQHGPLRIGDDNIIREAVTIHGGTPFGAGTTRIGDHGMFLAGSHVGHDAQIGDHVIFTNGAMVAGHSIIQDHAILGAMVGIHQFTRVGERAMIGAGAMVSHDAPPFGLVQGDRARLVGINKIGLKRAEADQKDIALLKRAYRTLFWRPGTLDQRMRNARALAGDHPLVNRVLDFVGESRRGVCMPRLMRPPVPEEAASEVEN